MEDRFDIVAREAELERIRGLAAEEGRTTLVVEGDAGIGKTTLWLAAVAMAAAAGRTVLIARPTSAETTMGFSAMSDLLTEHLDGILGELPAPQASALQVALLRRSEEARPDPQAISAGLLTAIRVLSARNPILIAVDDIQWLDGETAVALAFALRRLTDEPVSLAASLRTGIRSPGADLVDGLPPTLVTHIRLGPLSFGALHPLIHKHLDRILTRPVLQRIHGVSGGNPFYALELARTVIGQGADQAQLEVHLSAKLEDLVRTRLRRLPGAALRVLEPAALVPAPTVGLLQAMARSDREGKQLDRAARAGIISVIGDEIRFTHPLLAEGLAAMIGPRRRSELHARLAGLIEEPEQRARHLAKATSRPDAGVADRIEAGALAALARGASASSAELMEMAATLTPPECQPERWRRMTQAAASYEMVGLTARASSLIEACLTEPLSDDARADALIARWWVTCGWTDLGRTAQTLEEAASYSGHDDRRLSEIHRELATTTMTQGDLLRACDLARSALDATERVGDIALIVPALARVGLLEPAAGRDAGTVLDRGVEEEGQLEVTFVHWDSPSFVRGLWLTRNDRPEGRALLERDRDTALSLGQDYWYEAALIDLTVLECRSGNFDQAEVYAQEVWIRQQERGERYQSGSSVYPKALVAAYRGRVAEARSMVERGVTISTDIGDGFFRVQNQSVLGFLELSLGDAAEACRVLAPLPPWLLENGWKHPNVFSVWPNAIETLISTGDLGRAAEYLALFEPLAERTASPATMAESGRCHAMLLAAQGDLEGAILRFDEALREHEGSTVPFERARTLLSQGVILRRMKRKGEARAALDDALDTFRELGTPLWAERAEVELSRIGGRIRSPEELTATERRVADLVTQGKTNREVATELFVTVRSVESNLTKIYTKLGVRSRAELTARSTRRV